MRINKLAALTPSTKGESYNCASGVKVTIQELADAVLEYFGKQNLGCEYQDWKPGDILKFDVKNSKVRGLGFEFNYTFKQGLHQTLDWLVEHLRA